MRKLPYPGHTWSFTQHAIGIEAETLYNLLGCASIYEGESNNLGVKITQSIIENDLLTANIRDGVADAWRDYQQILAELGLIYSTKISRNLQLTEAGHMFLAGELGYSELIGMQALRYQYPNGQKTTIQSRLSTELANAKIAQPETLLELQANYGMLVKPGALLLRILIDLYKSTGIAKITIEECLAFVLPCQRNDEWPIAKSEILANRKKPANLTSVNAHGRRNMQDWFTFLDKSELFSRKGNSLDLTKYVLERVGDFESVLDAEEDPGAFWIPKGYDLNSRFEWFSWYGRIALSTQKIADHALDDGYVSKNFVGGLDEDEDAIAYDPYTGREIRLTEVNIDSLLNHSDFVPISEIGEEALSKINLGAFKRHSKTILHNRIIVDLARKLESAGAILSEDRNSVDLLAHWPDKSEAIFEVKTVTARNISSRLRMAIGQVEEYAYRRKLETNSIPDKVIVINSSLERQSWQVDFLLSQMKIGLIYRDSNGDFSGFAPTGASTAHHWL